MKRENKIYIFASGVGILMIIIDQITKYFARQHLQFIDEPVKFIPGVLDLTFLPNTGAAFGILENHRWVFISITTVIIFFGIFLIATRKIKSTLMVWATCLVISGGIGNMIDRVFLRYVVDFLHIRFVPFPYIFNIADSCVVIGAGLIMLYFIFDIIKESKTRKNTTAQQ